MHTKCERKTFDFVKSHLALKVVKPLLKEGLDNFVLWKLCALGIYFSIDIPFSFNRTGQIVVSIIEFPAADKFSKIIIFFRQFCTLTFACQCFNKFIHF